MAERMRWWVIPGALVVLMRVVTLEGQAPASAPTCDVAIEADEGPGLVVLRDAAGQRTGPVAFGSSLALVVSMPAECVNQRGVMTIWRRLDGAREREPWLVMRPRVRSDATVPIAGLSTGHYDLEMQFGDGEDGLRLLAPDAEVPGEVTMRRAP